MLIDLHAHAWHPDFYNMHPHWGPFFESSEEGHLQMRVGHWRLTLGSPEAREAVKAGHRVDPQEWLESGRSPKARLAMMDAAGQDVQVVSIPSHAYMYWAEPEFTVKFAQKANDSFADLCSQSDNRLLAWAHAPMEQPEEAAKEIRRAVTELGCPGVSSGGSWINGMEFDDPAFDVVWKTMCDLDVPMFVHGYNESVTWGERANDDRYETTSIVGMNYAETRCFWYMTNGGVFDRFPDLKVYITHGGGFVPYQLGRLDQTNPHLEVKHNKKRLLDYIRNFWFDVELHELPFRQALTEVIDTDRILYGTNFGGSDFIRHDLTDGLRIAEEDLQKIRWKNAADLLHLDMDKLGRVSAPKDVAAV
jgi:predicted TIM-barrel fold metal-dependent hydrolase